MSVDQEPRNTYGRITETELAKLQARIGQVSMVEQPFIRYINRDSIQHVCRSIGDTNPFYTDGVKNGSETVHLAPPAIFYAVAWGSWDLRRGEGLPGVHGLHSGDHWWYYLPVNAGDEIYASKKLIRADPMTGRLAGSAMVMQAREIDFFNQRDELVARQHMEFIRAERNETQKRGKYADVKRARYTDDEIAGFEAEMLAESPRGSDPRYWEDVNVGDAIQPIIKGPLTVTDMICWLQAVGSPHVRSGKYWAEYHSQHPRVAVPDPETRIPQPVERVHWDDYMAREAGMPSAYDYGSQRGAYATYAVTNWMGDTAKLIELYVQYRGMFFLGDVMRITGAVSRKWIDESTGEHRVELTFSAKNQHGSEIMPGTATISLPVRGD